MPAESTNGWCLDPIGHGQPQTPGQSRTEGADVAAVDHRGRPVDRSHRVELVEQGSWADRRHAVVVEQPSSRGRCAHANPVTSTKTIALQQVRSDIGRRPWRSGTDTGEIIGLTTSQSSSRTLDTVAIGRLHGGGVMSPPVGSAASRSILLQQVLSPCAPGETAKS